MWSGMLNKISKMYMFKGGGKERKIYGYDPDNKNMQRTLKMVPSGAEQSLHRTYMGVLPSWIYREYYTVA